jgi:hypothetical protein
VQCGSRTDQQLISGIIVPLTVEYFRSGSPSAHLLISRLAVDRHFSPNSPSRAPPFAGRNTEAHLLTRSSPLAHIQLGLLGSWASGHTRYAQRRLRRTPRHVTTPAAAGPRAFLTALTARRPLPFGACPPYSVASTSLGLGSAGTHGKRGAPRLARRPWRRHGLNSLSARARTMRPLGTAAGQHTCADRQHGTSRFGPALTRHHAPRSPLQSAVCSSCANE